MQIHEVPKFKALLQSIGILYGKHFSADLADIYWRALECFDYEDVQRALNAHVRNPDGGQFFPRPADVVRFIEGSGETRALQAWATVERAIKQVGSYQSIAFDDFIIHAVLEEMGGWIKLCAVTCEDLPFRSNEFQKRYMAYVQKAPNRYPKYLHGISEQNNAKNGFPVDLPVLVGDREKAKQVMLKGGGISLLLEQNEQATKNPIPSLLQSTSEGSDDEN